MTTIDPPAGTWVPDFPISAFNTFVPVERTEPSVIISYDRRLLILKTCTRCRRPVPKHLFPKTTCRGKPLVRSWCAVCLHDYYAVENAMRREKYKDGWPKPKRKPGVMKKGDIVEVTRGNFIGSHGKIIGVESGDRIVIALEHNASVSLPKNFVKVIRAKEDIQRNGSKK